MSIITLLTDFGLEDEYVGVVKGVILSIHPSAGIVDITHQLSPHDLTGAALTLGAAYPYFPKRTVHMVVVDPGVGSSRRIVGLEAGEHVFIAPDNGVLTRVLDEEHVERAVSIEQTGYFLDSVSRTFHGRDVFAPVAARLAAGLDLGELGPSIDPREDMVRLEMTQPYVTSEGRLMGEVMMTDRFGNLMTNIKPGDVQSFLRRTGAERIDIRIGSGEIRGVSDCYACVALHQPLCIIGSRGYLEISVNGGSAAEYFKAGKKEPVRILPVGNEC